MDLNLCRHDGDGASWTWLAATIVACGCIGMPATASSLQDSDVTLEPRVTDFLGGEVSELLGALRQKNFAELRAALEDGALADVSLSNELYEGFLESNTPSTSSGGEEFAAVASALRELTGPEPQIASSAEALDLVSRADTAAMSLLGDRLIQVGRLSTLGWSAGWTGANPEFVDVSLERWTLREWLLQLAQVHVFDQTDLAARETLDAAVLTRISALCRSIVSIQYLPLGVDRSRASPKGVGFLWKGRVLTAAHVVSVWARDEADSIDLGRLLLVFPDESGRFDATSALVSEVKPLESGSYLLPRWDTAVLAPAVDSTDTGSPAAEWLRRAELEPLQSGAGDPDLNRGLAFSITAFPLANGTRVALVAPGPIVFAPRADVPRLPEMALGSAEFKRAFRFETFARLFDNQLLSLTSDLATLPVQAYNALVSIEDGGPAYTIEAGDSGMARRFAVRTEAIDQLVRLAPEDTQFASDRCVEVFGCDLVTMPGMSGSPVFLLEDGTLRVVGLHISAARSPSARVVFPHTRNVALAVPFHRILPHIR